MNKILIKCKHVVCPNNVSLICINLLGLLAHVEVSSVIDLQANNVCQTDSSGSGRCPPSSPSLFSFFEIKIQASRTIHYYEEEWKKMNNNNLLCDKQCYSSEAIISKIKNTITSSLACFLTIKMQSRVSVWKLCKTEKKLSYVKSHHNLITITFTLPLVLVWWYKFPYTVAELFGTFFAGIFVIKRLWILQELNKSTMWFQNLPIIPCGTNKKKATTKYFFAIGSKNKKNISCKI